MIYPASSTEDDSISSEQHSKLHVNNTFTTQIKILYSPMQQ